MKTAAPIPRGALISAANTVTEKDPAIKGSVPNCPSEGAHWLEKNWDRLTPSLIKVEIPLEVMKKRSASRITIITVALNQVRRRPRLSIRSCFPGGLPQTAPQVAGFGNAVPVQRRNPFCLFHDLTLSRRQSGERYTGIFPWTAGDVRF